MMFLFACFLLCSVYSLTAFALPARHNHPVCIVGAGPAGLTAASRLESKGYETIIFERQPEIGGKCQSYYDEHGIFHPLGAAFFSNATYTETVKIINASEVPIEPFALAGAREQFYFNWTIGVTEEVPALSSQFVQELYAEIPRYISLWEQVFAPYSAPSYKNGVPEALTVPGDQWFATNNFTALPTLLVNPLALYGYGDIRVVPILYILQYITPDLLTAFVGEHDVYYTDFHRVWVQWTERTIKSPIHVNTQIDCIDRSGDLPVITYTKAVAYDIEQVHQKCSSVILAFPPTIDNLDRVGIDLTHREKEVFETVGVHNYFSSAINITLPFGASYIEESESANVPPPDEGEPVAVLRLSPNSTISTSWSWGPYREFESTEDAYNKLISTFSKINKDPRNATAMSEPFTAQDVEAFRKWDYFPHFDSEQLACGYYEKYNNLQGHKNTYWMSGLNGMETVEWTVRGAQDVVDSNF